MIPCPLLEEAGAQVFITASILEVTPSPSGSAAQVVSLPHWRWGDVLSYREGLQALSAYHSPIAKGFWPSELPAPGLPYPFRPS